MAKTVADIVIERLIDWGVDTIFGLPGDGINGLFEALRTRKDDIRFIQVRATMQFSCSGTLASMANALPYSVGAAVGHPGRQVVCIIGDGGFTMLMGEVATLVKYKLPVKVIVLRNNLLGMIKWEQMIMEGNPQYGVELQPIDFAAFSRACGAAGFTLERPGDAEAVLSEALQVDGPAVVDAIVDPNEPPMPGHVSMEQALKFAEALARGQRTAGR